METANAIWFGGDVGNSNNTDQTFIQRNNVSLNVSELGLYITDDDSNSIITLPLSDENNSSTSDYVTIRGTNGIHHAFSSGGNYYYGNSILPRYSSLPNLTGTQIGGSYFVGYTANLGYYTGFHSLSISLPMGYYLANGYIAITPSAINLTLSIGLGANDSTFLDDYIKTQKPTSLDRIYSDFSHYLKVTNTSTYYLNLYNSGSVEWLPPRYYCNFIRLG